MENDQQDVGTEKAHLTKSKEVRRTKNMIIDINTPFYQKYIDSRGLKGKNSNTKFSKVIDIDTHFYHKYIDSRGNKSKQ